MAVQEPLYWVNNVPIYPTQNSFIIQTINNVPDTIDVLGELKINSLVFNNPSEITIESGGTPYSVATGGTSYIQLVPDKIVTDGYGVDNFKITFDKAAPPAKILLVLFSSSAANGGLKIVADQILGSGLGSILLKDNEDIIVDPTEENGYNRASILFVSDGVNWIELNRFLYGVQ
jgi:hypothetical protein